MIASVCCTIYYVICIYVHCMSMCLLLMRLLLFIVYMTYVTLLSMEEIKNTYLVIVDFPGPFIYILSKFESVDVMNAYV